MAFGFGFNKQKVLSAAEKFVQQGKLQNAIAEYEKILNHDAKDLTVTNTVGDLYARLGENPKAVECFKRVGDAYAAQGFTVKGIAMYKKITKLVPSVDGSLKLAELYTQQGLFNDARAQYLQVAEDFIKSGNPEQAVRLFQKILEMDPENVAMRVKLAEVYVKLGKKKDAWEIFSAAAESLRARGSLAAAEDILQRMLKLEPGNSYVLLLRGHGAIESNDPKGAIQFLEKAADLDSHPEGLRDLLKAYLQVGDLNQAAPLAEKLLSVHNDPEGLFEFAEGAARAGQHRQALQVYLQHADRFLATDSAKLQASLHTIIGHVRDDADALDTLLQLLNKAGDNTHVTEVSELLAHACVKDGDLVRARDLYQALAAAEPENQVHLQNYQQVLELLSGSSPSAENRISPEEGEAIIEELESTAPVIDQSYPDPLAIAIRSAVIDADLFLSYNLPEKAIVPLLTALPQAPRDVRLNQRLAALHIRADRFTEAAVCCRTLESVFHDAGFPDEAVRYGELAARYEVSSEGALSPTDVALPSTPTSAATPDLPAPRPAPEAPAHDREFSSPATLPEAVPEFAIHEPLATHHPAHDLSSEWEESISVEPPAAAPDMPLSSPAAAAVSSSDDSELAETVEEMRFYLEHFMVDQARASFVKLQSFTSDPAVLEPLRAQMEASGRTEEPEAEITEISEDDAHEFELQVDGHPEPEITPAPGLAGYHDDRHPAAPWQAAPSHAEPVSAETLEVKPAHKEPPHHEPAHAEPVHAETSDLDVFVSDLESSLGDSFPAPEPPPTWPGKRPSSRPVPAPAPVETHPMPAQSEPYSVPVHAETRAPDSAPTAAAASAAAGAPPPTMSYSPAPVRPLGAGAQAMHPADSVDLSEMFGELKHELEEGGATGESDPETHYNLGVAFREMGLLDEAIAELQKVCTAIEHGHAFPQTVQTYTWLAQCFLDKSVPEAAIRWYEKALSIPGLDPESRLAINYELGSACESAQDRPAALRHFTEVYGANIDYRDVAERIQALKS
jgi:tetratricopeptide (TPR) repeat protein